MYNGCITDVQWLYNRCTIVEHQMYNIMGLSVNVIQYISLRLVDCIVKWIMFF